MTLSVLTVKEAAEFLRVSASMVYKLIREGKLPCVMLGCRRVIPLPVLENWLAENVVGG